VLQPQRAKELRDSLAQPQSRAGLAAALTQLKSRLDDIGLTYDDLSGADPSLAQRSSIIRARFGMCYEATCRQVGCAIKAVKYCCSS
jgi:hypothetical protein